MANTLSNAEPIMKNNSLTPWVVVFSAALFFFYEFVQMNMFNAISPQLMKTFHLNAEALGFLSASYFYADVLFLFPTGILLDRISTRTLILVSMCVCVLGTLLLSFTHTLWIATLCRFMTGIGNAFSFLSCIKLASRWFPPRRMALVTGLIVTLAMLGGVVAQTPFALLSENWGWRQTLQIDAALGLVLIGIIFMNVKNYPKEFAQQRQQEKQQLHSLGLWTTIKMALSNRQNWLCGIYTCLLNLPIFLLGGLWGGLFLEQVHHLDPSHATYVTSMIFTGTIVGSPTAGWISDRMGLRKPTMYFGAVLSLGIILILMHAATLSAANLGLLFFALGFFTSTQIVSYPAIGESNPKFVSGTATGLASVLIMGGGAVFQPFFGQLMDLHWDHAIINNVPHYAASDFRLAMTIMPIAFIVGFIAVACLRETRCQGTSEGNAL